MAVIDIDPKLFFGEEVKGKNLIGRLQSRIAKRGIEISELDFLAQIEKNKARRYDEAGFPLVADTHYREAAAYRSEIKPLAEAQKLDREILNELYNSTMIALETAANGGLLITTPGFTLSKSIRQSFEA